MEASLEARIKKIIESGFETPRILKRVLAEEMALLETDQLKREILGLVYVEPTYILAEKQKEKFSGAFMILATSIGIIIIEEGLSNKDLEHGGYRARYIPYSKIKCVELDSCLLLGIFKLIVGGSVNDPDILIEFDTAAYLKEFDNMVRIIRSKMTALERGFAKDA